MVLHGGVPDKSAFATQAPPYSGVQQSPGSQPGTAGLQATCTQASSLMDVCLRHFLGCALLWAPLLARGAPLPCGPFSRALLTAVAMLRQPPPGRAVLSVYTRFHTGQDASSPPAHAGGAPPAQCRPKSRACCLSRVCWDLYVPPSPAEGSTTPPLLDISSVPPATTQGLLTPTLAVSL